MASPTRSAGTGGQSGTGTLTLTTGAVADGKVLYAHIYTNNATNDIAAPAGWTTLLSATSGGPRSMRSFRIVANSLPTSHAFTSAGSYIEGVIDIIDGADTTTPEDVTPTVATSAGSPLTFTSITTNSADTLNLLVAGDNSGAGITMPGGYTVGQTSPNGVVKSAHLAIAASGTVLSGLQATFAGGTEHFAFNIAIKAAASGPNITSVSTATPREGASLTITGTAFGASQGGGGVTINGVAQTVTSWSDTSVAVTVVLGTNKFGAAYNVILTDSSAVPSNTYAGITGLLPANSGLSYVDLGTPNSTSAYRLTSSADLVSGDQIEYSNVGGLVTVNSDATFSAGPGVSSFSFRVWTSGSGYGQSATQLTTLGGGATDRPIIRPFNKRSGLGF